MLAFYWQLGKEMSELHIEERWGDKVIRAMSSDLKKIDTIVHQVDGQFESGDINLLFFDASEIADMVHDDFVAYSESYARMQEMETAVSYNAKLSYEEGMEKGMEKERASLIKNMLQNGLSPEQISSFTGIALSTIREFL